MGCRDMIRRFSHKIISVIKPCNSRKGSDDLMVNDSKKSKDVPNNSVNNVNPSVNDMNISGTSTSPHIDIPDTDQGYVIEIPF